MTAGSRCAPRALVVGLGIGGLSTALRLSQIGWEPVVVERAPARRLGGYYVALFGPGTVAAERLGILDRILDRNVSESNFYEVDRAGRMVSAETSDITLGLPPGARSVLRSDIERALFEALPDDLEIRFSTVPTEIRQADLGTEVTFRDTVDGTSRVERFDLVIGADGMRSTVRQLVFGPHANHMHSLNCNVAFATLRNAVPGMGIRDGLTLTEVGRSAAVLPFKDHDPFMFFMWRNNDGSDPAEGACADAVRAAFGPDPGGPVLGHLLDEFERADDSFVDSIHQVRMRQWHHGRVVLVGDSAWNLTLLAGLGASSALAGGELLGSMIEKNPDDVGRALDLWQARLRPFIDHYQQGVADDLYQSLPENRSQVLLLQAWTKLWRVPFLRQLVRNQMYSKEDLQAMKIYASVS